MSTKNMVHIKDDNLTITRRDRSVGTVATSKASATADEGASVGGENEANE
jgi:hypothetical protein